MKVLAISSLPTFASVMPFAHIVRCFNDDNVVHVAGEVNPLNDIAVINTELALADLATVEKALNRYAKQARSGGDKEAMKLVLVLEKLQPVLNEACPRVR